MPPSTHLSPLPLQRERHTDGFGKSSQLLKNLYHGKLAAQEFPATQGVHTFTVNLTKDTNEVNIVLQHLSGEPVDKDDYIFTITDYNGMLDWDNSIMPDEKITYFAHYKEMGSAGLDVPEVKPRKPLCERHERMRGRAVGVASGKGQRLPCKRSPQEWPTRAFNSPD